MKNYKENFQNRLNEKYPNEKLKVLLYTKTNEEAKIQCLTCGKIYTFKLAKNAISSKKQFMCKECCNIKQDNRTGKQKFKDFITNNPDFELLDTLNDKRSSDKIRCRCKKCGKINEKTIYDYLRNKKCTCTANNTQKTTEEFIKEIPDDYVVLSEYKTAYDKVLIKHVCGFVYSVTPHNLLNGKGCPRCRKKQSKGESAIENFLKNKNIDYVKEYPVSIKNHLLRFDFYIPAYDMYIEYNGIQHYEPIEHFGGEERLKKQLEYDEYKANYAKGKLLIISYKEYDNIEEILNKTFKVQRPSL